MLEKQFTITSVRDCPLYQKNDAFSLSAIAFAPPAGKPACLFLARTLTDLAIADNETAQDHPSSRADQEYNCPGCSGLIRFEVSGGNYQTLQMKMLAAAEKKQKLKQMGALLNLVSGFSFFKALDESSLKEIMARMKMRHFDAGTTILHQGQPGRFLYLIVSGRVSLLDSKGESISFLGMGEIFGEMSLLSGSPVSATVKAAEPVKVLYLEAEDVKDILLRYPFLQHAFSRLLIQRLASTNTLVGGKPVQAGISGKVEEIGAAELFQLFHENLKSGRIAFTFAAGPAWVQFREGEIVGAAFPGMTGIAAFYAILAQAKGEFSCSAQTAEQIGDQQPLGSFMKLLMDGLRQIDEQQERG